MHSRLNTWISFSLAFASALAFAQQSNDTKIAKERVGVVLNPDGRFFLIQKPIYNGIKLFFDSKPNYGIELISTSDDLDGQKKAADETVKRSLRFVIGHNFSGLAEVYLRALPKTTPITYVTPFATSTGLTSVREGVYLVWPDNERQIRALVNFSAKKKFSLKKVVTVVNESETYSVDMAELFRGMLAKDSVTTERISYIRDSFNAKTIAEKIKALNASLLFLPIYNRELIELYQALWESTPDKSALPIIICGDTVGSDVDFYKMLGDKVKVPSGRFFFTNGFAKELLNKNLREFATAYKAKFGEEPNAGAVAGYHAAQVMYELMQKRKGPVQSVKVAGWKGRIDGQNRLLRPLVVNEITVDGFKMREVIND